MYPYLKLCIRTWRKFLPEYKIIILDYETLNDWVDIKHISILKENFALPQQADVIRCAVLRKYGGYWFDADTIITSSDFDKNFYVDSEFALIGRRLGFIKADANAKIFNLWMKEVNDRLLLSEFICKNKIFREFMRVINKDFVRKRLHWNFLGNDIINKHLKNLSPKEFYSFDHKMSYALPQFNKADEECWDLNRIEDWGVRFEKIFIEFYIENDYSDYILEKNLGIVLLYNSFVPIKYKQMSDYEILNQNNTFGNIFKKLLS